MLPLVAMITSFIKCQKKAINKEITYSIVSVVNVLIVH